MQLVKCPEDGCGAYNDSKDTECARCGKQLGTGHKQDDKKRWDETHRRKKRHFDDESDEDSEDNYRR